MMIDFTKMHGAGNDFVVIDAVRKAVSLSSQHIKTIADRHTGVGCDQVLVIEPPKRGDADFEYKIFNADGSSEASAAMVLDVWVDLFVNRVFLPNRR